MREFRKPFLFALGGVLCGFALTGCFRDRGVTEPDYQMINTRRPALSYMVPTNGATYVPANTIITVWFDKLMNEQSVQQNFTFVRVVLADSIRALAYDPKTPATAYAGKLRGGIFKSSDGGASWLWVTPGLPALDVRDLVVNPQNTNLVLSATGNGVYKSLDGGLTWTESSAGLTDRTLAGIDLCTAHPDVVVVVSVLGGVFRSTDGGTTWVQKINGLGSVVPIDGVAFMDIVQHPSDVNTLYVATRNSRMFKSSDGGEQWNILGSSPRYVERIGIAPVDPDILYAGGGGTFGSAGVFRSSNGGASWAAVNTGLPNLLIRCIAVDAKSASRVLVGASSGVAGVAAGVFVTTNAGASWLPGAQFSTYEGSAVSPTLVSAIAIHPVDASAVCAGTSQGIFVGENGAALLVQRSKVKSDNLVVQGSFSFSQWRDTVTIIAAFDSVRVDTVRKAPYVLTRALSQWIASGRVGPPPIDPSPPGTKFSFIPSQPLEGRWLYQVTINGTFESDLTTFTGRRGAEDTDGNTLEKDIVSRFTTR